MGLQRVLLLSTHRWFDLIWWYIWSLRIAMREHHPIFLLCAVFCCMVCFMPWSEGSHSVLFRGRTWIVEGCNSRSRSCGLLGEWAIVSRLSELKWSIDWKNSMQWIFLFAIPSLWYWYLKNIKIQGNLWVFFSKCPRVFVIFKAPFVKLWKREQETNWAYNRSNSAPGWKSVIVDLKTEERG